MGEQQATVGGGPDALPVRPARRERGVDASELVPIAARAPKASF